MIVKTLLLAALGVVGTAAQLTNSSLLSILNTTQLSPSPKFIQLLQSSPDYQPVLELLSQPGNITLFVPSDAVFDRLIKEFQETQQTQGGGSSGSGGGTNGGSGGGTNGGSGGGTNGGSGGGTNDGSGGGTNGGSGGGTNGGSGGGTNGGTTNGTNSGSIVGRAVDAPAGGGANDTIPGSTGGGGGGTSSSTAGTGTSSASSSVQASSSTSSGSDSSPTGGSSSNGTTGGGSSGNGTQSSQQNVFPQGFSIFSNFTVIDILYYHILQEKVMLKNQTNRTVILNSLLTNQTANKFGYGMPIILNSNTTQQNSSSSGTEGGSGGGNGTASSGNSTSPTTTGGNNASPSSGGSSTSPSSDGSSTSPSSGGSSASPSSGGAGTSSGDTGFAPQAASWISRIKQLMDAQSSGGSGGGGGSNPSQSGGNSSETPVYWIGNGLANANVTLYDIEASNGVLHVIDDVLIPPGNASNVFANISEASSLSEMIEENPEVSQALNNATNVTIFAPNDKGLCMVCIDQLGQDKWKGLVMNHVVQGIYYSNNLTSNDAGGSPMSLTTEAGETLPVSSNSSGITLNNTIQIVTPNILFNGGVIHLIDKIIEPPQNSTVSNNGTAAGPSESSSAPAAASSTSAAQPSSSAASETTITQPTAQSSSPEASSTENPVGVEQPSAPEDPPPKPAFDNPFPPTYL